MEEEKGRMGEGEKNTVKLLFKLSRQNEKDSVNPWLNDFKNHCPQIH
jgi:hypothetical protein